jgi:hypothetical protein
MAFVKTLVTPDPIPYISVITAGTISVSAPIDVSNAFNCTIGLFTAVDQGGTASTQNGLQIVFEGCGTQTGHYEKIVTFTSARNDLYGGPTTAVDNPLAAGSSTVHVSGTAGMTVFDYIMFKDSTAAHREISRIDKISGTTLTIEDVTLFAHALNTPVLYGIWKYHAVDVSCVKWLRFTLNNNFWTTNNKNFLPATGHDVYIFMTMVLNRGVV